MKIHITCAVLVGLGTSAWAMDSEVESDADGRVTPVLGTPVSGGGAPINQDPVGDGGEQKSPAKPSVLPKKPTRPASVAGSHCPSNRSVGTTFGSSAGPFLDQMRDPSTLWNAGKKLLGLFDPDALSFLKEERSQDLADWHTKYQPEIRAMSSLIGFMYESRGRTLPEENFDSCKNDVRNTLLMIVGLQPKRDRRTGTSTCINKIYTEEADALRKWAIFFSITVRFSDETLFPYDPDLISMSEKYKLGISFESLPDPLKVISKESFLRSLWEEKTGRVVCYDDSIVRDLSKLLQIIDFNHRNMRALTFAQAWSKWSVTEPDLDGFSRWLQSGSLDVRVLGNVPVVTLVHVLNLTPEAAKVRWNKYEEVAKKDKAVLSRFGKLVRSFSDFFRRTSPQVSPQSNIWEVEFLSVLERIEEEIRKNTK